MAAMLIGVDKHVSPDDLSRLVLHDIAARSLRPGDRYLTADEARQRFGVRKGVVEATFRSLSDQNILVRRQRAGTFVGPGSRSSSEATGIEKILVLMGRQKKAYFTADEMMRVYWRRIPGVTVQFVALRGEDETHYVRSLIDKAALAGERVAVVAVSCSRSVYEVLASSGIPAVVLGSVDAQFTGRLTSFDTDAAEAGRLLVRHLLARGKSRIAVVMDESWRVGDNHFFEGVRSVMSEAGLPVDGLRVASLPPDPKLIRGYVASSFADGSGPTAFISRPGRVDSVWMPRVIAEALRELNRAVPDDVAVVYHLDCDLACPDRPPFPCTHRTEAWDAIFERVADVLLQTDKQPDAPRRQFLTSVALHDPAVV